MASTSDLKPRDLLQGARVRSVCVCVSGLASDYLNLCVVKNHEEGVKSIATNSQRHTSVPQSYVGVL